MIVSQKAAVTVPSYIDINDNNQDFDRFGDLMSDGRLTEQSDQIIYRLREAILLSKQLGRPLTEQEMKAFEV